MNEEDLLKLRATERAENSCDWPGYFGYGPPAFDAWWRTYKTPPGPFYHSDYARAGWEAALEQQAAQQPAPDTPFFVKGVPGAWEKASVAQQKLHDAVMSIPIDIRDGAAIDARRHAANLAVEASGAAQRSDWPKWLRDAAVYAAASLLASHTSTEGGTKPAATTARPDDKASGAAQQSAEQSLREAIDRAILNVSEANFYGRQESAVFKRRVVASVVSETIDLRRFDALAHPPAADNRLPDAANTAATWAEGLRDDKGHPGGLRVAASVVAKNLRRALATKQGDR